MSSDHERLQALRRITLKRGATKAEVATAKRLADELEAKIEKKPRARRRNGQTVALPEPPAARKKRLWGIRLDWALEKADRLYMVAIGLYFLFTPVLVLTDVFGGKAMERQVDSLMWAKLGLMVLLGLFFILVIVPITFARWWLRTRAGTRLGKAWSWVVENAPIGFLIIAMGISPAIEKAITGSLNMALYAAVLMTGLALAGAYWAWLGRWRVRD
jgi:hypothetical protein